MLSSKKDWRDRLDVVMRQDHRAGEKLFVDYAGQAASVIDRGTGELRDAQVFVAVLGASNYTYAEATWSQSMEDWIGSHVHAFEYFGAVPEIVVPENLKSGVNKAHRYEPRLNHGNTEHKQHPRDNRTKTTGKGLNALDLESINMRFAYETEWPKRLGNK